MVVRLVLVDVGAVTVLVDRTVVKIVLVDCTVLMHFT